MNFVLKHVFSNVSKMKVGDIQKGNEVSHAGVNWSLSIHWSDFFKDVFISSVNCNTDKDDDWFVDSSFKFQLLSSGVIRQEETHASTFTNNYFMKSIQTPLSTMDSYLVDDQIVLKCNVNIKEISGHPLGKWKFFDHLMKEPADVFLVVKNKKFHVSKQKLSNSSSFFKSLFFEAFFEDSENKIVELTHVDPQYFQFYLQVIYKEPAIKDSNVRKTLELAEKYGSSVVTKTCEAHLLSSSCKFSTKTKIRLSCRFKLENLLLTYIDFSKSLQPLNLKKLHLIWVKSIHQRVLEMPAKQ